MSDDAPVDNTPAEPETATDPPGDSSPFDLPPMDVVTRNDDPPDVEARDGDE